MFFVKFHVGEIAGKQLVVVVVVVHKEKTCKTNSYKILDLAKSNNEQT